MIMIRTKNNPLRSLITEGRRQIRFLEAVQQKVGGGSPIPVSLLVPGVDLSGLVPLSLESVRES